MRRWKTCLFVRLRSLSFCPFIWILDEQLLDLSLCLKAKALWLMGKTGSQRSEKAKVWSHRVIEQTIFDSQTICRLPLHWRLWTLAWVENKSSSRHQGKAQCKGWKMYCANELQARDTLVCIILCLEIWLTSDSVKSCHMLFPKIKNKYKLASPSNT